MAQVDLSQEEYYPTQVLLDTVNNVNGGVATESRIANAPNVLHFIGAFTADTLAVQARVSMDHGDWVEISTPNFGDLYSVPEKYNFVRVVKTGVADDIVVVAQFAY